MKDTDVIKLTPFGLLSTSIGMPAAEAAINELEKFCRRTGQALAVDQDGVFRFVELHYVPPEPAPPAPAPIKEGDRAWLKMKRSRQMVDVLTVSGCGRYAKVSGLRAPTKVVLMKDLTRIEN